MYYVNKKINFNTLSIGFKLILSDWVFPLLIVKVILKDKMSHVYIRNTLYFKQLGPYECDLRPRHLMMLVLNLELTIPIGGQPKA